MAGGRLRQTSSTAMALLPRRIEETLPTPFVFLEIADDMESHADRMEGKCPANNRRPSS